MPPVRDIAFTFVAHDGPLELFAVLLASSLREVYGAEVEIIAGLPEEHGESGGMHAKTLSLFASLNVVTTSIANPISLNYPIGNKLGCLTRASEIASRSIVVFLDTDMLALSPIRFPEADWEVGVKPGDSIGRGHHFPTWARLYALSGLPLPADRVLSTVDRKEMLPYFNAGFIAVRGLARALGITWIATARAILAAKDRDPVLITIGDDLDPERRINHLDQFALPIAIARKGLKTLLLEEAFNYPLPHRLPPASSPPPASRTRPFCALSPCRGIFRRTTPCLLLALCGRALPSVDRACQQPRKNQTAGESLEAFERIGK